MINQELNKNNIVGKGWQYTVYDLGNGRVYKKFNSYGESLKIIVKDWWFAFWMAPKIIKEIRVNAVKSLDFLENFLRQHPEHTALFGNFKKVNELDIEQDKIISLKTYFKNHSIEESKVVIDKFVELCRLFYSYGFMDKALKVGVNFGINESGQVVLVDIGEIWFDEERIKSQIKKRVWKNIGELRCVPRKLRKYYIQEINKLFIGKEQ